MKTFIAKTFMKVFLGSSVLLKTLMSEIEDHPRYKLRVTEVTEGQNKNIHIFSLNFLSDLIKHPENFYRLNYFYFINNLLTLLVYVIEQDQRLCMIFVKN